MGECADHDLVDEDLPHSPRPSTDSPAGARAHQVRGVTDGHRLEAMDAVADGVGLCLSRQGGAGSPGAQRFGREGVALSVGHEGDGRTPRCKGASGRSHPR